MKKEDDKTIIEMVQNDNHYQIKTTPEAILRSFEEKQNLATQKEKASKRKKKIIFSLLGGAGLAMAASILTIVIMNNHQGLLPSNVSPKFMTELISFSNYQKEQKASPLQNRILKKNDAVVQENDFYYAVDIFDEHYSFLDNNMRFDEKKLSTANIKLEKPIVFESENYLYQTGFSYQGEPIFTIYYNDLSSLETKNKSEAKAIYVKEKEQYRLNIAKEFQIEGKEYEEEFHLTFFNINDSRDIYSIEKEKEVEGKEAEHSYTLKRFQSLNDFQSDKAFLEISYEFELDGKNQETQLEIKGENKEYEFDNIIPIENGYQFDATLEDQTINTSIQGITLKKENDKRHYRYQELEKTMPN